MFGGRLGSEPSEQGGRLRGALLFVQTKALIQVVFHGTVDMLQYADKVVTLVSIALTIKWLTSFTCQILIPLVTWYLNMILFCANALAKETPC